MDVADGRVEDLNLFADKQIHSKITGWPLGDRPQNYNPDKGTILQKHS